MRYPPRSPACRAWSWWCRRRRASSARWCWRRRSLPASTRSIVAAAKRLVFGKVGIDMIAGPSEVLILADRSGHPDWIAADLLAQAEHDASAQSILITDDAVLAENVEKAVSAQLGSLPRASVAAASWRDFGAIILVGELEEAVPLVDAIAPEHLEIASEHAERLASRIRNAGAIFLGPHTPEAIGDYVA